MSGQRAARRRKYEFSPSRNVKKGQRLEARPGGKAQRCLVQRLHDKKNRVIIIVGHIQPHDSRLSDDQSEPDFQVLRLPRDPSRASAPTNVLVGFDRRELQAIFNIYGRMVAQGAWRDYAMDFFPTRAIFSIFRHSGEAAYYRIVKEPRNARMQGVYSIVMQTGLILKRGPELPRLLAAIEKKPKLASF